VTRGPEGDGHRRPGQGIAGWPTHIKKTRSRSCCNAKLRLCPFSTNVGRYLQVASIAGRDAGLRFAPKATECCVAAKRRYVPKPPLVENRPVYAGQFIIEAPERRAVSTVESGTNWTSHPAFINNHLRRFIATTVRPPTKSAMSETTFAKTS